MISVVSSLSKTTIDWLTIFPLIFPKMPLQRSTDLETTVHNDTERVDTPYFCFLDMRYKAGRRMEYKPHTLFHPIRAESRLNAI